MRALGCFAVFLRARGLSLSHRIGTGQPYDVQTTWRIIAIAKIAKQHHDVRLLGVILHYLLLLFVNLLPNRNYNYNEKHKDILLYDLADAAVVCCGIHTSS